MKPTEILALIDHPPLIPSSFSSSSSFFLSLARHYQRPSHPHLSSFFSFLRQLARQLLKGQHIPLLSPDDVSLLSPLAVDKRMIQIVDHYRYGNTNLLLPLLLFLPLFVARLQEIFSTLQLQIDLSRYLSRRERSVNLLALLSFCILFLSHQLFCRCRETSCVARLDFLCYAVILLCSLLTRLEMPFAELG